MATRAGRVRLLTALYFSIATFGGYMAGSPLPRCFLGTLHLLSAYCMQHCHQWQRTAILCLIFTVGPYSELYQCYVAYTQEAEGYPSLWFDAFVFSLIMMQALPFIASTVRRFAS